MAIPVQGFHLIGKMIVFCPSMAAFALGALSVGKAYFDYRDVSKVALAKIVKDVSGCEEGDYVALSGRLISTANHHSLGSCSAVPTILGRIEITRRDIRSERVEISSASGSHRFVQETETPEETSKSVTYYGGKYSLVLESGIEVPLESISSIRIDGCETARELSSDEIYSMFYTEKDFKRIFSYEGEYSLSANCIPKDATVCVIGRVSKNVLGQVIITNTENDSQLYLITLQKIESFIKDKSGNYELYGMLGATFLGLSAYLKWR